MNANPTILDGQKGRRCVTAAGTTSTVDGFTLKDGRAEQYLGAYDGGGMAGGVALNCFFIGNAADGNGGGMVDGMATNCTFSGNGAFYGGGIFNSEATNCTFSGNWADYVGAGMYGGTATNCSFSENTALAGGGMSGGSATNCTFTGNEARYAYPLGGGSGGGMSGGTATNCTFIGNEADYLGAGMDGGTAINCIFFKNEAINGYGGGAGMAYGTAFNCTFSENSAGFGTGGGMFDGVATNCILWGNTPNETIRTTVSYSCLSLTMDGTGNIVAYPLFVNPSAGDFRLRVNSPCIDKGTSNGAPLKDILGRPRPQGGGADMGAYEYQAGDDINAVASKILRVNVASSATNPDGLTWETAFPTLQAAADRSGHADEIWAAKGTYIASSVSEVVKLLAGTLVFGGFLGTETTRDQRDWTANPTIIDGENTRRCITANAASFIDGFIVQNGIALSGGGMLGGSASHCAFYRNSAGTEGGGMSVGTAINCTFSENAANDGAGMSHGKATNCTFSDNMANNGGGTWMVTAFNCVFSGNNANNSGGGMYKGTATDCTFTENVVKYGSGGGMSEGIATNCVFTGNRAEYGGGTNFSTTLNCTFYGNSATYGGGMAHTTATNCIIWGNSPSEAAETWCTISYSCLSERTTGTGNIVANPLFVNPWGGNFRLCANSPCVDAGTADGAPATDLLGRTRPQGKGIDMGAYEYHAGDDSNVVRPVVLRVSASSTATNQDGLTWETAFSSIQAAADFHEPPPEIWVAKGTYTISEGYEVVNLKIGISLFGGFSGTETARDQRDCNANPTIIDGQRIRRCIAANDSCIVDGFTLKNGKAGQGGGLYYGTAINCTFIKNAALSDGGGMFGGTATNCTFIGNSANYYGGGMYQGVAINCTFSGNVGLSGGGGMSWGTVVNCTFSKNAASKTGGGMYGGTATNCTFSGNLAPSGAGMNGGTATNCILWGNSPSEIMKMSSVTYSCLSKPTPGTGNIVANPLFVNLQQGDFRMRADSLCIDSGTADGAPANDLLGRTRPQGAGIDMGAYEYHPGDDAHAVGTTVLRVNASSNATNPDGLTWETAFSTIQAAASLYMNTTEIWCTKGTYTVPEGNEVVNLSPGTSLLGGFSGTETAREQRNWIANPTIIDGQGRCRCVTATDSSSVDGITLQNGNVFYDGGGMYGGTAVHSVFNGNSSTQGGGMYGGSAIDCIFTGNSALSDGGGMTGGTATNCLFTKNSTEYGGGIYDCTAVNCTFSGNFAKTRGGGADSSTVKNCIIWGNSPGNITYTKATYSCLPVIVTGTGNIVTDPLFVNAAADDFRLEPDSPCIDAGTGNEAPSEDILGIPRPQGAGIDMGAYEVVVSVMVPDVNGLTRIAAQQLITNSILLVGKESEEYSATTPKDQVIRQNPVSGTQVPQRTLINLVISKGPQPVPVPEVVGLTQDAAAATITGASLTVGTVTQQYSLTIPAGTVISQSPVSGTEALPGTAIDLMVSRGGIPLPDLTGQTQETAAMVLSNAGLAVGTVSQQYSLSIPVGGVISQNPAAGTQALPGATVDMVVSRGGVVVPGVAGQMQSAATTVITDASLVVGIVTQQYSQTIASGVVISQIPGAGISVSPGTAVSLVVSRGTRPPLVPFVVGIPQAQAESVITGTGLTLGSIKHEHSDAVAAGNVISQNPTAGGEVPPETVVSIVVSLGPIPVVEGEGEPPVDIDTAQQQLAEVFDQADTSGDGQLSFDEAVTAIPRLPQEVFNNFDTNADGQLTPDELGLDAGCGCAGCPGTKSKSLGDGFTLLLGLLGLAAMAGLRSQ